ncbi:gcn5-related [hydrocarbon metagenome]|uniref:Gcn5-related n=1 Tax=hydrocarbon metagenome TaxID=938273 RepID=A0A0W8F3B3_9ZZZZ
MMKPEISVHIVREWEIAALVDLYRAGGWWLNDHDPTRLPELVRSSFAFAVAVEDATGRSVGMGRVISDGVSDAYIQDMVVIPEFRGRGAGRKIIRVLLAYCYERGVTWIGLIAEPGTEEFYTGIGFSRMKDHIPMRYRGRL